MKKNAPRVAATVPPYLEYLDRHGSLVPRLCNSGLKPGSLSVNVTMSDSRTRRDENSRSVLSVTLVTVPGAGHFTANQEPARIADLIVEMVPV